MTDTQSVEQSSAVATVRETSRALRRDSVDLGRTSDEGIATGLGLTVTWTSNTAGGQRANR